MGVYLGVTLNPEDVSIGEPNLTVKTVPEDYYISLRNSGGDCEGVYPLPSVVPCWNNGICKGENCLVALVQDDLYLIADDVNDGLSLFHYVYDKNSGGRYKLSYTFGKRVLGNERRQFQMAIKNLADMSRQSASGNLQAMNLSGGAPQGPAQPMAGDGVSSVNVASGAVNANNLVNTARMQGYIAGYIVNTAPAITVNLQKSKDKDGHETYNIVAKESKPSRILQVLMALPSRCVMRARSLATPNEILAGQVDFSGYGAEEMTYLSMSLDSAIGYLYALGSKLPEYAPNVSSAKSQWTREEIIYDSPKVSYVQLRATENKRRLSNTTQDSFHFTLRPVGPRRILFTEGNHICLRALTHMSTKCTNEKEAYALNESAFGAWRFQTPRGETITKLQKAMNVVPTQIWTKQYTLQGENGETATEEGIGSCFFMPTTVEKNDAGEDIGQAELMYQPWNKSGANRAEGGQKVTRIVQRVRVPASGTKKERMKTLPVYWKDDPNNELFKPYHEFLKYILNNHFIREDTLKNLGGRATKARTAGRTLSSEQKMALESFLKKEDVVAQIQEVQQESSRRATLSGEV